MITEWINRPLIEGDKPMADDLWLPQGNVAFGQEFPNRLGPSTWSIGAGANWQHAGVGFEASNTIGAWAEWDFVMPEIKAGSGKSLAISFVPAKGTNCGIVQVKFDGVTQGANIDCYGTGNYQAELNTRIVEPPLALAKHTIRVECVGKNASSAGYFFVVSSVHWRVIG